MNLTADEARRIADDWLKKYSEGNPHTLRTVEDVAPIQTWRSWLFLTRTENSWCVYGLPRAVVVKKKTGDVFFSGIAGEEFPLPSSDPPVFIPDKREKAPLLNEIVCRVSVLIGRLFVY